MHSIDGDVVVQVMCEKTEVGGLHVCMHATGGPDIPPAIAEMICDTLQQVLGSMLVMACRP